MSEGGRRGEPAGGRGLQQRDEGIEERKEGWKDLEIPDANKQTTIFICGGVRCARVHAS